MDIPFTSHMPCHLSRFSSSSAGYWRAMITLATTLYEMIMIIIIIDHGITKNRSNLSCDLVSDHHVWPQPHPVYHCPPATFRTESNPEKCPRFDFVANPEQEFLSLVWHWQEQIGPGKVSPIASWFFLSHPLQVFITAWSFKEPLDTGSGAAAEPLSLYASSNWKIMPVIGFIAVIIHRSLLWPMNGLDCVGPHRQQSLRRASAL